MNPPSPLPYLTFLPSPHNPNPNPNPNFFYSHLNHHPSSTTTNSITSPSPPPPLPQPPDLPTALSTLKHLIHLSETTLHSISTLLPTTTTAAALCPCPFNFHHRLPPESLFRHSLQCPSSPSPLLNLDPLLLQSLRYPNTLKPSQQLLNQNRFLQTLHDPNSDLCFSLDDYCEFGPNFFYRNCPGVVSSADRDSSSRTFSLPGILSIQCANFVGSDNGEIKGFSRDCVTLLPSELWLVRSEIESWRDYPIAYSYRVLRIILCSVVAEDCDFLRWVIVNSPRYGVVIDVPMRDHIVLLFQLCLKAIVREATGSVDSVLNRDARELNPAAMSLKCPILVEVLKWLSFQFSVLYGEVNGKLFAIGTLKQWMLNISLNSSLFLLEQKAPESPASRDVDGKSVEPFEKGVEDHVDGNSVEPFEKDAEDDVDGNSVEPFEKGLEDDVVGKSVEPFEKGVEDDGNSVLGESINSRVILVSQVAAAVAALHERALLEEKIKALRSTQSLTSYQRTAEHAYFSNRADEERQKRLNYRPVLEHDGFLWQRPHNQSTNKAKTREELLAEERDYKRRRMSYRGKKSKRSTTQVMRDIIEEYMDDITQAGGIGCLINGTEEAGKFTPEPSLHDIYSDVDKLKKNVRDSSEMSREWSHGYKKQLDSHNNIRSTRFEHVSSEDRKRHRQDSSRHHEHLDTRRSVERDRRDRDYYSKSPDRRRSRDHSSNREHRNNVEWCMKNFSRSSDSSHSRSHERQTNRRMEQSDRNSETKDRRQRHAYRDRRSGSVTSQEFEDRYDPSESRNMYED
ncbi:hypothetical protein ACSBR2_027065 [Camellia fascicularis]